MTPAFCLALAVYFEARSEPIDAQYAVAEVIMNRVESDRFPNTVCGVVTEDRGPEPHDCQFSFWCDGKPETIRNQDAWELAKIVSEDILNGGAPFGIDAEYYHADYVKPYWADVFIPVARIGSHIFYTENK